MKGIHWHGAAWLLAGGVILAAALVVTSRLVVPEPPRGMAVPSAGELVALEPYLDPERLELPEEAGIPASVVVEGDPFRGGAERIWARGGGDTGERPGAEGGRDVSSLGPRWNLSAIMIAGNRRIAFLNDRIVRPGDRLEGGVRVAVVERDHVVLIMPDGERRRLQLERSEP